jgi:hypothetical protein
LAGRVLPGDFEQGRGILWQASRELKWQVFLASKLGGLFSWVNPADFHGKIFWVILAHSFGGFSWHIYWRVFTGNETSKLLSTRRKRKEIYNQ